MNKAHLEICSSPEWARQVEEELLPWVLDGCELGDDLLEVGPGPGLTTDVLRRKAARVTAVELDLSLAGPLATRLAGSNVRVIAGDVTRLPFPAGRFGRPGHARAARGAPRRRVRPGRSGHAGSQAPGRGVRRRPGGRGR